MFLDNPGSISLGTWTPFGVKVSLRLLSCVFRNMACRLHGKHIFMHWASTFDAETCHGPILGTARIFFVPQGCSSGFLIQWGTRGSQNEQIASHAFMTPEGSADI